MASRSASAWLAQIALSASMRLQLSCWTRTIKKFAPLESRNAPRLPPCKRDAVNGIFPVSCVHASSANVVGSGPGRQAAVLGLDSLPQTIPQIGPVARFLSARNASFKNRLSAMTAARFQSPPPSSHAEHNAPTRRAESNARTGPPSICQLACNYIGLSCLFGILATNSQGDSLVSTFV